MVVPLALLSTFGAAASGLLLWPTLGWAAVAAAPCIGSALAVLCAVTMAPSGQALEERSTDDMVEDLRAILEKARAFDGAGGGSGSIGRAADGDPTRDGHDGAAALRRAS